MPIDLKSGSLNLLEPSGPVQACNGIILPLPLSSGLCHLFVLFDICRRFRDTWNYYLHLYNKERCMNYFIYIFSAKCKTPDFPNVFRHQSMTPCVGVEVQIHKFLTFRVGDERSPSFSGLRIHVDEPGYTLILVASVNRKPNIPATNLR